MKITFKDVGQGDSIILEWNYDREDKIGIIDCSKKGKTNPVIDYLKTTSYTNIEFIILSHPHTDHYSGMIELLEYCKSLTIKITSFYHTLYGIGKNYWKYFELDSEDNKQFGRLINLISELDKKEFLEIRFINVGQTIDLYPNAYLRCMSPSHKELEECQRIMKFDPALHKKEQSSAANYLATIFKLKIDNNYALLTSDAEVLAFQTILSKRNQLLTDKRLILSQMSHHGSYKNYEDSFWSTIKRKKTLPAVASAGKNAKYKHPDYQTLKAFVNHDYTIHSTSPHHGMAEYIAELENIKKLTSKLDTVSDEAEEYYIYGDKTFNWNELIK
ncbi:hypothetical protein [uncultured Algibacter sp.]|uniref:ComEC/Rec2 family competence protein n=1 Tax=uncultured Algibacter sp. TaxID=298659 RepID=UPI00262B4200|nr:hypothetical protein [uncultured Algibacter sp.]